MTDLALYQTKLLQHVGEHDAFLTIMENENVKSYLEIGSMYGGSLWRVAHSRPKGTRVVSVDYAIDTPAARPHLEDCISELGKSGYDAHFIYGDSRSEETVDKAHALGPYDVVFIDGDHTLEGATSDWEKYGPMGRIVCFHDIAWNNTWRSSVPGRPFKAMGVPELWNSLKSQYRYQEIKMHGPGNYYGIGVLWRDA